MISPQDFLKQHRGVIIRSDWLKSGLSLYSLYTLKKYGDVHQVSPGIYAVPDAMTRQEDIVQLLSRKHPRLVMSLLSALQFHEMTTQIPQNLFLTVPRNTRVPKISFCPLTVKKVLPELIDIGVEIHEGEWEPLRCSIPNAA